MTVSVMKRALLYFFFISFCESASFAADSAWQTYLTCKESCVPHRYRLTLDVPQGTAQPDPALETLVRKFRMQVPPESEDVVASLNRTGPSTTPKFGWIVLLAFAGGLILNIMPCV